MSTRTFTRRDLLGGRFLRALRAPDSEKSPPAWAVPRPPVAPPALDPQGDASQSTAHILMHLCVARRGEGCRACAEQCPVPGAITVLGGRPVVSTDRCTGCGVCRDVCPAPTPAVRMLPKPPEGRS